MPKHSHSAIILPLSFLPRPFSILTLFRYCHCFFWFLNVQLCQPFLIPARTSLSFPVTISLSVLVYSGNLSVNKGLLFLQCDIKNG